MKILWTLYPIPVSLNQYTLHYISHESVWNLFSQMCVCVYLQGLPTCSIQWGPWASVGMAVADVSLAVRLEKAGVVMVQPEVFYCKNNDL